MIRRSDVALETPLELLTRPLTPNDAFFVRNHAAVVPRIEPDAYRLTVRGARGSRELSLDDLRPLPRVSEVITLACSGNGRTAFDETPPGIPWGFGAVGTARWDGVRLRDVLAVAGIGREHRHVVFDGYDDAPDAVRPPFRRSLPLERALHDRTLVVDTMNGERLPAEHGGPARLLVAGWTGNHAVKWLRAITLAEHADDGWWMREDYRVPARGGAMRVIDAAAPLAIIAAPSNGETGPTSTTVQGIAYGEPAPRAVRVELDDEHAGDASVRYADGPYAWGRWSLPLKLSPGAHRIAVRPIGADGGAGPPRGTPNPKGYLYDGPHAIELVAR